ncbi:MAG TPA: excinuclease ABC subunit UvrA [Pseudobdellovibrionaceae bacterium]|jgi:excinuclease ABC subunit A
MASNQEFDGIVVKGAKEHNLKDVSVVIPRNKITVFTGLSGSGKSSLAFDTVYAEGQRRYVESLSAYARNFLEQLKKPEVDSVTGLSPAIAIDQKSVSTNPRSTVGTVTEIYDYMRLLFAKVGVPECPTHHLPVSSQTPQQILEEILKKGSKNPQAAKFHILAPMAQGKKGEFMAEFQRWARKGFVKAQIDGKWIDLEKATKLAKTKVHDIDLVVDQVILKDSVNRLRLAESINTALSMANGRLVTQTLNGERVSYSLHSSCPQCGYSFPEIEPRIFSFNNPRGACLTCHGLGTADLVEEEEFSEGVVGARRLEKVKYTYKGKKVASSNDEEEESEEMVLSVCPDCQGARLKKESLNVRLQDKNIAELSDLSAVELRDWLAKVSWKSKDQMIAEKISKQILNRLDYLIRVGTGYLSLSRPSRTLSGGEAQRIRLATQVGSSLIGVLYVMDEPSIGLHPRDHHRLLHIIAELKDRGNTILLVEHDEDTIRFADHVVDLGPRAGRLGGEMMAAGTPQEIEANPKSLTGRYLSGELRIPIPRQRRQGNGQKLRLIGASGNNLKNVTLEIPLGTFTAVTGVSGSGKSTLIIDTLFKILAQRFYKAGASPSSFQKLEGIEHIDKVIDINQRPIGRTPRSTPATYVGLFPMIRDLFAGLPDSKLRGYPPGRFSFNVKGGRCETCLGHGQIRVEMHFMSDVFVKCETCLGARYNRETLNVKYKGKSISDILNMSVLEALELFKNHPQIYRKLETLNRVGLDYMTLGQSSTTLSGGEAQRVKLSKELSRRGTGKTLYILDEPTTGLHFEDIKKLVELIQDLSHQGNTVLVIEHNLEVVKCADHVIDLGPDGGKAGGLIIATGTPEQIVKVKNSETGKFLKAVLK